MSHRFRMIAFATVTMLVFATFAGWLGLSYLGVISKDVRVDASVISLGDSLGPGSKVRYHGLIVGSVHSVSRDAGHFGAELLIRREDAERIPRDAKARVLPATLFGSEYVELVGGTDAVSASGPALRSGDTLLADTTQDSVRLMDSIDDANRLLKAVDSEKIDSSIGALAAALDGHGDDIGTFLTDADDYVTTMTAHRGLLLDDLALLGRTADTLATIEPRLRHAAENSRTSSKTIVDDSTRIGALLGSTTALTDRGTALMNAESGHVMRLLRSTGPTLRTFAIHNDEFAQLFQRVPIVLSNGANGIKGHAIQMEGLIDLNPLDPYTSADCTRYGSLAASNCSGAPSSNPAEPSAAKPSSKPSGAGLDDLVGTVQGLLDSLSAATTKADR